MEGEWGINLSQEEPVHNRCSGSQKRRGSPPAPNKRGSRSREELIAIRTWLKVPRDRTCVPAFNSKSKTVNGKTCNEGLIENESNLMTEFSFFHKSSSSLLSTDEGLEPRGSFLRLESMMKLRDFCGKTRIMTQRSPGAK